MTSTEYQQLSHKLDRIAAELDRLNRGLIEVASYIARTPVLRAPGGGGAGVQPRGVETGIDASQAFLSGQWVRRSGDVWGPTAVGAKKRETP